MGLDIKVSPENINNIIDKLSSFIGSIVSPGAKEIGLLFEDKVRSRRVLNQVQILLKVKNYVEERGLKISAVPLKILVPLLEHGSLEEEEELQDLWAKMLTNMLDTDANFQNHVFPYILSQISLEDFNQLNILLKNERELSKLEDEEREMTEKHRWEHLNKELGILRAKLYAQQQDGFDISSPECDNLERLGLCRRQPPKVYIPEFKTGGESVDYGGLTKETWHSLEAEYDTEERGFRITTLGLLFLNACELED